jgi:two-component system chemotaxis sensor kinase CheA
MDELDAIRETFFQECEELLADLESGLSAMQNGAFDNETVNGVFRAVHSIKGGAGAFGLEPLVRFAHVFETLLDGLRSDKIVLTMDLADALLRAADVLADHVAAAAGADAVDETRSAEIARVLEAFSETGEDEPVESLDSAVDELGIGFTPMKIVVLDEPAFTPVASTATGWAIRLRPRRALFAKANDVSLLMRELERLGPITCEINDDFLPSLDSLDPEESYLAWTITLDADVPRETVVEVFEFVEGDCDLSIDPPGAASMSFAPPVDIASLIAQGESMAPVAPPPVPTEVQAAKADARPDPKTDGVVKADAGSSLATIRVEPARIDRLIDLVGELVINQAMLSQRVFESGIPQSSNVALGLDELEQLTREIQDSVMAIRAQPVRSVFQRMPRLVREVASMTSKQVRLVTEGEGTEVDKTVIERLSEPITHMLRNAIDHGLESPDERIAVGKPREGVIRLAALHRSGRIVIEVADDGRGINREKVYSIAVKKGLVSADAQLSDDEIDNLIFLPGFSTAATVSDISGRGVGMDVVRRSVQALGGRIAISSKPGQGSTFTLSLPLTLAVLDGMVVDVAGQTLVVPINSIIESLQPAPGDIHRLGPKGVVLSVRDSYVPVLDVGEIMGYRAEAADPVKGVLLLVEGEGGTRAALVVDSIQGQRQVVIKSLEANYTQVEGIAAATILGDGRVALILDLDAVISLRTREQTKPVDANLFAAE